MRLLARLRVIEGVGERPHRLPEAGDRAGDVGHRGAVRAHIAHRVAREHARITDREVKVATELVLTVKRSAIGPAQGRRARCLTPKAERFAECPHVGVELARRVQRPARPPRVPGFECCG